MIAVAAATAADAIAIVSQKQKSRNILASPESKSKILCTRRFANGKLVVRTIVRIPFSFGMVNRNRSTIVKLSTAQNSILNTSILNVAHLISKCFTDLYARWLLIKK